MPKIIHPDDFPINHLPANTIYIDAGSIWEMPQTKEQGVTRDQLLEGHKLNLAHDLELLRRIDDLRDCDLVTFGAHDPNHGEILITLAGMTYEERVQWATDYLAQRKAA